ncbi:TonB-dependent receptor plug domain-containing protein [Sphingorhabdus arenilitoris]|uniref:TonB-dependent receptor plug domain-containing protein n=1 Tax=Sphingorhabdus arenilitoris TaxID=1490041 RepID=A0ABV8RH09_9SPHN
MLKSLLKCGAACAVLGGYSCSVWAQDSQNTDQVSTDGESFDHETILPPRLRPIIVTANGAPSYPEQVGQSITEINLPLIEQRQAATISDLIDSTPGVTVSRNGGIGKTTALRIRGAEGDQTLTLIDGVRVNDPSSPGGGFDFGNLLIGNIERVEILRGPNSVPWGSQAIGGVVNIVTSAPQGLNARAEYGSNDRSSVAANAGIESGILSASLGGGYFRDDAISAFRGGTEADGYRQYAANGKIGLRLSDDIDVDLRGYFADSKTDIDGFPPPLFSFADTTDFSTAQEIFGYAGVNFRLFDGALKNRAAFTIADINRDNFSIAGQAVPDFLARGRTERFEYVGDAQLSGALRSVFGIEHENSRFNDGFTFAKTNVSSAFGQIIADPSDSVTFTGGARFDDHRDYGSQVTFSANGSWRPSYDTVIRAAYGEGFKAPTLFQLRSDFGNVTLKPEQSRSYEVSIEQKLLDDRLTLGAALFLRNSRDQIDFASCFGQTTGICTNRPFGTYDNIDRTRAKGLELQMNIRPADNVTIDANYSYTDSEDRTSGLALLRRPKHDANINADWQPVDGVNLGASLQMVGDSFDTDFQTFTRTQLDGYALVALRASYQVTGAVTLYGRVDNLGDENYETVSGYGNYGRTAHIGIRANF